MEEKKKGMEKDKGKERARGTGRKELGRGNRGWRNGKRRGNGRQVKKELLTVFIVNIPVYVPKSDAMLYDVCLPERFLVSLVFAP